MSVLYFADFSHLNDRGVSEREARRRMISDAICSYADAVRTYGDAGVELEKHIRELTEALEALKE